MIIGGGSARSLRSRAIGFSPSLFLPFFIPLFLFSAVVSGYGTNLYVEFLTIVDVVNRGYRDRSNEAQKHSRDTAYDPDPSSICTGETGVVLSEKECRIGRRNWFIRIFSIIRHEIRISSFDPQESLPFDLTSSYGCLTYIHISHNYINVN